MAAGNRLEQARQAYLSGRIEDAVRLLEEGALEAGRSKDDASLMAVIQAAEEMKRTARVDAQRRLDEVVKTSIGLRRQVASGEVADPSRAREADSDRLPSFVRWVDACVAMFGTAAVLSAIWGIAAFVDVVRDGDGQHAVSLLFVGLLAAAVWVGFAVALVMLREIALGARTRGSD